MLVFTKWKGEIQIQPMCYCYTKCVGDVEFIPCVSALQNSSLRSEITNQNSFETKLTGLYKEDHPGGNYG